MSSEPIPDHDDWPSEAMSESTVASTLDGATRSFVGDAQGPSVRPDEAAANEGGPGLSRGTSLGRYVILTTLGHGGMGVVYEAYDPELHRRVALKLVRVGDAGDSLSISESRSRLLLEAQALAQLSHPNVVAVYDVGALEHDVFVAMEFVEGQTLGAWLKAETRPRAEILAHFIAAGRGLAAAHAVGLIHRDFKPDNVMIGADGRVRVLDFGLACGKQHDSRSTAERGVDEDSGRSGSLELTAVSPIHGAPTTAESLIGRARNFTTGLTEHGVVMGTPRYMSPEQHAGRELDARSDQFSFCVALYEALYGARPFAGNNRKRYVNNVMAGRLAEPPSDTAVPSWLRAILVRGLARRADDRYPSLDVLLDELGNDPTVRRRRRIRVAGVGLGLLAVMVAGIRLGTTEAPVCEADNQSLVAVWNDAAQSDLRDQMRATGRSYADRMATTVAEQLDTYATAWSAMRHEACEAAFVRRDQSENLFDRRVSCLHRQLEQVGALIEVYRSDVTAEMVDEAPQAFSRLPQLEHCADEARLLAPVPLPPDAATQAEVDRLQAVLDRADALDRAGAIQRALTEAERVVAAAETLGFAPFTAKAVLARADLYDRQGDYERSEAEFVRASQLAAQVGDDEVIAAATIALVGTVGGGQADGAAGKRMANLAQVLWERAGRDPVQRIRYLLGVAYLHYFSGDTAASLAAWKEMVEQSAQVYGEDSLETLDTLGELSLAYLRDGAYADAARVAMRQYQEMRKAVGDDHPAVASALRGLADVEFVRGDYAQAREHQLAALRLSEATYGKLHWTTWHSARGLAQLETELGNLATAESYADEAWAIAQGTVGPEHPSMWGTIRVMGELRLVQGRIEEAEQLFRRGLTIIEARQPDGGPQVVINLEALGRVATAAGRLEEAEQQLTRALDMVEKLRGTDHPDAVSVLNARGEARRLREAFDLAGADHQRAVAIYETANRRELPAYADGLHGRGVCALGLGDRTAAVADLERAYEARSTRPEHARALAQTSFALAQALIEDPSQASRARELATAAKSLLATVGGAQVQRTLADVQAWLTTHAHALGSHP